MQERSDRPKDAGAARSRTLRRLAALVLGLLIFAPIVAHAVGPRHRLSGNRLSEVAPLVMAMLMFAVAGLLLWELVNLPPEYWRVREFSRRRRVRVSRALRRGTPILTEDLPLAAAAIAMMHKQKGILWAQPVFIAASMLNAFMRHGFARWMHLGLALVMSAALGYTLLAQRRSIRNWQGR